MPHVLLVQGSQSQAHQLGRVFESAGFDVVTADSIESGVAVAVSRSMDVIIADATLVDGTGLQFCRALRQKEVDRRVPVVLHTAVRTASDVLDGLEAGADGYLLQDLTADEIIERVQHVIHADQEERRNGRQKTPDELRVEFLHREYCLQTPRGQLVRVLVAALEDLSRADARHEDELVRRREAEQKLRDSEALYESLVDSLPMNLYRKDASGRLTFANRMYCESRGATLESMLGQTDFDMFPRELAEKYTADDRRIMENRDVFEDTESHVTADGDRRYMHVLKTPVTDASGQVIGTQGIFWDVTARRRAEDALERERFLLNSLLDNIPDNVFFKDLEGCYLRINRAMALRLGLSSGEKAVGRRAEDFFPADYAARIRQDDEFILKTGKSIVGSEQLIEWPDGSRRWVSITRMPLRDPAGQIMGSFGVSHDITDQKQAQEAMKEARDAAEAASEAKSNFLANMSHEIRTPMNAIIGMTELVLDTPLTSTQREFLTMVQESGEALLCVINDVLDFSKIEAGRMELDPRPFFLRECLGDSIKSLGVRAHGKNLELAFHVDPAVPEQLIGDAGRLRQVITNLVGNAIKFTEEGEVLLDVSTDESTDRSAKNPEAVCLHFQVRDTGIGIPEQMQSRIFEAFEQADTSMRRRYEGTGLGLAITSRLVELMNGRIWVESEPSAGSTFHFIAEFPVVPEAATQRRENPATIAGKRILVVDDNATNLRILAEMLRNWLIIPKLASSAAEAMRLVDEAVRDEQPFHLVLSDVNMPDIDGFTLIERLRERSDHSLPVVMMLTSGGREGDPARMVALGISSSLVKPVKQSELFDALVAALDVSASIDEASVSPEAPVHSHSLRVLLAEDSLVNQKLALSLLQKWGHRTTVANNGKEAVQKWHDGGFDVVLMDVQMPEMDGLEATSAIRALELSTGHHTPIIAMTAHALKGDEERCLQAGMDAYLSKPIRAPQLFQKLASICDQQSEVNRGNAVAHFAVGESSNQVPQESRLVDWKKALEVVAGDQELLRDVLDAILQECPGLISLLERSIAVQDAPTARRAAHTLLGNMRAIDALWAMEKSHSVETLIREGRMADVAGPLDELKSVIEAVMTEVREYLADR